MSNVTVSSGGNWLTLLGVAFVVLKLCNIITWSWWWVTLPFWGGFALVVIVGIIWVVGYLASEMLKR